MEIAQKGRPGAHESLEWDGVTLGKVHFVCKEWLSKQHVPLCSSQTEQPQPGPAP